MSNLLSVIWGTMKIQMKNSFVRPMYQFCLIVSPIANTILLYYMFNNAQMDNFMTYVVVGAGLSSVWECICFSSLGDINRERWHGTLPIIFSAPAGFNLIILGKIIGNTVLSLVSFALSVLTAITLFNARLAVANVWLLLVASVVGLCAFVVISQIFAYLLTLSRKTTLYMNCLSIPIALVCGFVVPVETLPEWLWPLSYALAPTWVVKLMRGAFDINFSTDLFGQCIWVLCVEIAVYILLCHLLYQAIERRVKINASLELV